MAPTMDLSEEDNPRGAASSKSRNRLQVQRRNGRWEIMLRAERVSATNADYLGSLEVRELMKVPAGFPPV